MLLFRLSMPLKSLPLLCSVLAFFGPILAGTFAQEGYQTKLRTARSIWEKDSNRISQLLGQLRDHATTCNRLDKDIAGCNDEIRRIEDELKRELEEMAQGRFCSQCGNIASQIERSGEPFMAHIRKVQGVVIPASPEQLEQARQRAATRIATLRQKMAKLHEEKKTQFDALNRALHELTVTIDAYQRHITDEKSLQVSQWADEAKSWEKKLTGLQTQLDAAAKQRAHDASDVQIRALEAQLRSSLASTSAAESRARQTATAFNQIVRRDMDDLARKAETIPSGQPLVDGWQIGKSITSQNISYVAGPVSRPQGSTVTQYLKSASKPTRSTAPTKSATDLLKGK